MAVIETAGPETPQTGGSPGGAAAARTAAAPRVQMDDLTFSYPRGGHRLTGVSLTLAEAEVCCLLGPNGAGKTTLLRCLLGLLRPHRGTVRIDGRDVGSMSARDLARRVAYVPQTASTPFPFTALDIAVMGRTPHLPPLSAPSEADRRRARDQLDRLGIIRLADRPFPHLSGGERQLVLLARALVQQAPVLVLDEPTAALDYGNEVRILRVVEELARDGHSVVMTSHQPSHALTYSDRAVLMADGRVVADGRPADVVTGESLTRLYSVDVHVTGIELPAGNGTHEVRTCVPIPTRLVSGPRG
ncbi:ABC transporter ATP-binding protein [Frankia sp. R43]|uniref:ABC transporter ATP-binding protein n=1 Tax=Frankia sp. R43 TaxID=269536 RepID=UPI001F2F7CCF|nr:ABC transporter ATP-binding protein [Frankia sp. R43]